MVHRRENDSFDSALQGRFDASFFYGRIAPGMEHQQQHVMTQSGHLSPLNNLASKWRRGDVVTDKAEDFRPLRSHMPSMKIRTILKSIRRAQHPLANVIPYVRASIADARAGFTTHSSHSRAT